MTRPAEHVARMEPYALASMQPPAGRRLVSLAQNECLRRPSPAALAAARQALQDAALYPDPDWTALREALAARHGLDAARILCGAGSLDLIGALARVYAGPGRAVLAPAHAYPFFRSAAAMAGARYDTAAENGLRVDIEALLDAQRSDTGLVFVANPGNPTGTRIPTGDLKRLRDGLRGDILLVIDEAYGEFCDARSGPAFDLADDGRTVILRTFSKAYGLAGMRVGWGLFPPVIAGELRKVLNPNNIPGPSQAAAVAALNDPDWMRETCEITIRLRDHAADRLRQAGLAVAPSHTNFLLIDFGKPAAAASADAALRRDGIFLRAQGGAGLPQALRMTVAAEADMMAAVEALIGWTKEQTP